MYETAQTFETSFAFNRVNIEIKSTKAVMPARALIELYNADGFQEKKFQDTYFIEFGTPIARTAVIIPPGKESVFASIAFKKQNPGYYCWYLRNLDENLMSAFFIRRKVPKEYTGGYAYLNGWRDETSDYASTIHGISASVERYLMCKGSTQSVPGTEITVDAPETNPIIVEGKGEIAHVGDVVRDGGGKAVGQIITGCEFFEYGELITKLLVTNVRTPQGYPVYNARVLDSGMEIGKTNKEGKLIKNVEVGIHVLEGSKEINKSLLNKKAKEISDLKEINIDD